MWNPDYARDSDFWPAWEYLHGGPQTRRDLEARRRARRRGDFLIGPPAEIEVSVDDGEVSLAGAVGDRRQKRLAEDDCERVAGVKDVHDKLHVASAAARIEMRRAKTG